MNTDVTPGSGAMRLGPQLIIKAAHNEGDILSAEAEAVAENVADALLTGSVGDIVEVALRVADLVVDGGRHYALAQCHHGDDQFYRARRRDQMPQHTFA